MRTKQVSDEELAYFLEMLEYLPKIGRFRWLKAPNWNKKVKADGLAGWTHSGMSGRPNPTGLMYRYITLKNRQFAEHQLVFFAETGSIPIGIDHKNGNGLDNRFSNLRVASNSQQIMNTPCRLDNISGYKGVTWTKNARGRYQWRVRIGFNGKRIHLGWFDDKEEASRVYRLKAEELFGEYAFSMRERNEKVS